MLLLSWPGWQEKRELHRVGFTDELSRPALTNRGGDQQWLPSIRPGLSVTVQLQTAGLPRSLNGSLVTTTEKLGGLCFNDHLLGFFSQRGGDYYRLVGKH